MSRRHDDHNDEGAQMLAAHRELLEFSIGDQLSPLAECIVRTLNQHGQMTLKELIDTMRREPFNSPLLATDATKHVGCPIAVSVVAGDIAVDATVKELMTRLVLHRVVWYDAENHTYSVALGYGLLLRTLFPLIMQFFQRRYGETGVTFLTVFYQLAAVPWDAAVRLATERRPALTEALRHCAREMERLGLIELVTVEKSSEASPVLSSSSTPDLCRLNVGNILSEMLRDAIQHQLLAERFADNTVAVAVMEAFTATTRTRRLEERPHGFPPAHPRTSTSLSLRSLLREVPFPEAAVLETVSRMCRPDGDSLLSNDGTSAVAIEGPYRFHYDAAVEAMRRDCCERLVFARHGVLGVRIMKLLLQHHYMEDRMLAEEAIATLPRTREVLHAMLRDGYVRQQEVPKSGILMDRQPKNAVFLWGCNMEKDLLPMVRMQVAKTLRIVFARLALERQTASSQTAPCEGATTSESRVNHAGVFSSTAGTRKGVTELTNEALRCQRAVAALESSALALMEMILPPEFTPSKQALREAIFAQLDAVKRYGSGKRVPFEEQELELQQIKLRLQHKYAVSGSLRQSSASTHRHNTPSGNDGRVVITPNTRRLPPIFAEQRKNVDNIRSVCTDLNKILLQLDSDISRGGKGGDGGTGTLPGEATLQMIQRRARRQAIAKMRSRLGQQQRDEEFDESAMTMTEHSLDWIDDVKRARLAAADEGLNEEQSVCDYAEEPVVPSVAPGRRLRDEVEAMEESTRKINDCVALMTSIDESDSVNHWWDSAMRTREMKAAGIRLNYHARRILRWNQRAREHFLVDTVTTNEQMERCRMDLLYLQEQQALFQNRIELCNKAQADAVTETATLQEALREANRVRSELQRQLLARAHERRLLPHDCEDTLLAELLLLLEHITWPAALQPDADRVKTWLCENAIPLDV